jgi:hypothetical protein
MKVRVGQEWRSTDRRDRFWQGAVYQWRKFRVLGFLRADQLVYTYLLGQMPNSTHAACQNLVTGRVTRIALKSLEHPKRYALERDSNWCSDRQR